MSDAGRWYARFYWSNDVIVDVLRFLLVIVLIYQATAGGTKASRPLGAPLVGLRLPRLVLPFLLFPSRGLNPGRLTTWFDSTSELLNFGAAIMNLVLWGTLLADRKRDPQLAVVSVGLGVVVTGAAISYGLRHLVPTRGEIHTEHLPHADQLVGWTVWCRAFWPVPARRPVLDPVPGNAMPPA